MIFLAIILLLLVFPRQSKTLILLIITVACLYCPTTERCHWHLSGVFIVKFEHISHLFLVVLLLTLNRKMFAELPSTSSKSLTTVNSKFIFHGQTLTLSCRRSLLYKNQSIYLQSKSIDWFVYYGDLRHERIKT